jgi:hypothetical protein
MSIKNKTKFAEKIGVSRRRLYVYIKEGMPVDSEEQACEWILVHYPEGAKNINAVLPSSGAGLDSFNPPGIDLPPNAIERTDTVGVLAKQQENEALAWSLLQDAKEAASRAFVPLAQVSALQDAVQAGNKEWICKVAVTLADSAQQEKPLAKVSAATRHYNLCSSSRLKTEAALIDMQNNEKVFGDKAEQLAIDTILKVLRPMRQMLRSMPARLAPRCNPAAVDLARTVLEEEIQRLFETTYLGKAPESINSTEE